MSFITVVAFIIAFALQGSRVLVASRPLWSRLPAFVQVFGPPLIPALASLAETLAGAKTWPDLLVALVGCAALVVPGAPSNRSSAPLQAGKSPSLTPSASDYAVTEEIIAKASVAPTAAPLGEHEMTPKWAGPSSGSGLAVLLLAAAFALHSSACGLGGSFWPKVEHCAPSPASLVSQVSDVLLAGGDYEAALKELALQDGAALVECAVSAAVDALMGKVGASPEVGPAVARGKAFMAKHGVPR